MRSQNTVLNHDFSDVMQFVLEYKTGNSKRSVVLTKPMRFRRLRHIDQTTVKIDCSAKFLNSLFLYGSLIFRPLVQEDRFSFLNRPHFLSVASSIDVAQMYGQIELVKTFHHSLWRNREIEVLEYS